MKRNILHILWVVRNFFYKCYDNQDCICQAFFTIVWLLLLFGSIVGLILGHLWCILAAIASLAMLIAWNSA